MEEGAVPQGAGMPVPRGDPKLAWLEAVKGTGEIEEVQSVTSVSAFQDAKRAKDLLRLAWIELAQRASNDARGSRYPHRHCKGDPFAAPPAPPLHRGDVLIASLLLCQQGLQSVPEPCERIGGVGRSDQIA